MAEPLAVEQETYEQHLAAWRQDKVGKFVLIKGNEVVGFFDTLAEAFDEGARRFGLDDFFVDQIRPEGVTNVTFVGQYHFQVH
jgi:hypothetical protein